jgi:hypothetical protein
MSSMFRSVYALFAGILVLGASVVAAENAASEASEQAPPPNIQGTTAAKGPHKMFQKDEKAGDEQKKEEKSEAKKAETRGEYGVEAKQDKEEKKEKEKEKKSKDEKKETVGCASCPGCAAPLPVAADKAKEPEVKPEDAVKRAAEIEANVRGAIGRLSTSGWRDAQAEVIAGGKISVPLLIEAMGTEGEKAPNAAYNLGGHTKADTGRATRQRTLGEVCAELLNEIVANHSNFKGELPAPEQKAWQEWWAANGTSVTFAK